MPKYCVIISLREQRALERKVHLAGKGIVKEKLARPLIDAWVKWVKTILRRIGHRVYYNDKGVSVPPHLAIVSRRTSQHVPSLPRTSMAPNG